MDSDSPQFPAHELDNRPRTRMLVLMILVYCLAGLWTIRPQAVHAAVHRMEAMLGLHAKAAAAAPAPSTPGN
jgi:hypothetical protein